MSDTVVLAVLGVFGTLAGASVGPWVQSAFTSRHDRAARLRDARTALLEEAIIYAQYCDMYVGGLSDWTERAVSRAQRERLAEARPLADLITARMWLIAPRSVREDWLRMVHAESALEFHITENYPEAYDPAATWELPEDDDSAMALRVAIQHFRVTARKAAGVA